MFGRTKTVNAKKIDMQISNQLAFLLKSRCTQCGFTILEIIVSLAIVAILTSIAIPRLHSVSAQHEVETTASQMLEQMDAARVFAQANNQVVKVCPVPPSLLDVPAPDLVTLVKEDCTVVSLMGSNGSASQGNWQAWVWFADTGVNRTVFLRSTQIPPDVVVNSNNGPVRFNESGQAVGLSISIQSNTIHLNKKITLSQSGRARLTTEP